jgi:hypothetical protein
MYPAIRHNFARTGVSRVEVHPSRIGQSTDSRLRQAVLLGIAPLAAAAAYTVLDMAGRSANDAGLTDLAMAFGLLFVATLSFAYYALRRFSLHQPPFVWACLLLLESVVSPLFDWHSDNYPIHGAGFVDYMPLAVVMCAVFTIGLWAGTALWLRRTGSVHYPIEHAQPNTLQVGFGPLVVFMAMGLVSLAAEIFIILQSGVLGGDLNYARTMGLVGTTILQPVVRLTDVGSLLASWMSLVASGPRVRRQYFAVGIFCTLVSMIMPALLQQRFGVLQAVLYFVIPRMASLPSLYRHRKLIVAAVPLVLVLVYGANEISSIARSFLIGGRQFGETLFDRELGKGILVMQSTHFRHNWLFGEVLSKGFEQKPVGGIYDETAFIGDVLIVLPRRLFPDKPVTTMEVLNGVMIGSWFSERNREDSPSVFTVGLWIQLFLLGGRFLLLPLAAVFSYGSLWLWDFGMRRSDRPAYVVMVVGVWFVTGWLAFNVALTTLEVPGIVLGMIIAHAMPTRGNQKPVLRPATKI